MQRLEFYDLKSLNKNTDEGASKESDTIYGTYIYACFIYFKLFSSMLITVPSGAKLKYLCKNSYSRFKDVFDRKSLNNKGHQRV